MPRNLVCPECGGNMETGIIVDRGHYGTPTDASFWMKGSAKKSFWDKILGSISTDGKQKYYVTALRCIQCGFLKFYAGPNKVVANQ